MIRYSLLLLIGLLACSRTTAGETPLQQLQARLVPAPLSRGNFEQSKQISFLPAPLVSTGRFVQLQGQGLYWVVEQPLSSELRIRDGQIQERLGGADANWSAPLLGEAGSSVAARILSGLLAADLLVLDEYFQSELALAEDGWVLELQPRNANVAQVFGQIQVQGDSRVQALQWQNQQGEVTRIQLHYLPPAELSDGERQVLLD